MKTPTTTMLATLYERLLAIYTAVILLGGMAALFALLRDPSLTDSVLKVGLPIALIPWILFMWKDPDRRVKDLDRKIAK